MITTKTRIVQTVGALLLAGGLFIPAAAAQAQTLEEIIEASLEAAGGREAMARITSVKRTGTFTMSTAFGDIDGDTEVIIIPNQKVYQAQDSDLFEQTSAWTGTSAWQSDTMQGTRDLEGAQAVNLQAQTLLHYFLPYNTPELGAAEYRKLDDTEVEGRPHHVVGVLVGTFELEILVDAETKMVTRVRFEIDNPQGGTVEATADSLAYEAFDGVMMPTRTTLDIPGIATIDTRYTTTELNVEVDHSIFEKP
jgi:hypothetical protein